MSNLWHELLLPELRHLVRGILDPVSALSLGLSCHIELPYLVLRTWHRGNMQSMLEFGHDALAIQCYPAQLIAAGTIACVKHGNLDCLIFVRAHGVAWSNLTVRDAAAGGHLSCLRYALEHGADRDMDDAVEFTINGGHLECLRYLVERGAKLWSDLFFYCATYGHLDCMAYLHEQGIP